MELKPRIYSAEKEYALPKETLWQVLADNNRLNEYIGLFPVRFRSVAKEQGGIFYREARAKALGLVPLMWQEYPFQWEEGKSYTVERFYPEGPVQHYTWGIEFLDTPDANKTRVRVSGTFVPRNALGILAIELLAAPSIKKTIAYMDDFLAAGATEAFQAPQKSLDHKVDLQELGRLEAELRKYPVSEEFISSLLRHLIHKSGHDAAQIEPYPVAREWQQDPDDVLRGMLYAAKAGMLSLSWNLICPNCRVSKAEHSSLSELKPAFHCDLCGVNYDASFDQFVELHFSVHPSIRKAYAEIYCVGAPMITPHVKVQRVVRRGETVALGIPPFEGLRLRVLQANHMAEVGTSSDFSHITYTDSGWSNASVSGEAPIGVRNDSPNDIVVVLEQTAWRSEAVTAAKVTAMQEFRDLFSSEVLSPGQNIAIGHVTILFTDLIGSTSLYETAGDSSAYGQVRSHFEFLASRIAKNSGSVVKTIGDAVMAVFHVPGDGLKAALEIQRELADFNKTVGEAFILRIGLFSGPAIAVNSNDRLDYFGRTINIAARIESQGRGGDIVFDRNYLEQASLRALLAAEKVELEPFQAKLKGIEGDMELVRGTVQG
jgi:class 3 adenylate cyclase